MNKSERMRVLRPIIGKLDRDADLNQEISPVTMANYLSVPIRKYSQTKSGACFTSKHL